MFQNKNTFNGYRQHIDMHCPASHSQSSIGFVLPSCCRAIGTGGGGGGEGAERWGGLGPVWPGLWRNFFFTVCQFFFIFQLKDQLVQRLTIQLLPLIKAVINFSSLYVNLTHGMLYISGVKCTKKKNHINTFFYKECNKWSLEEAIQELCIL